MLSPENLYQAFNYAISTDDTDLDLESTSDFSVHYKIRDIQLWELQNYKTPQRPYFSLLLCYKRVNYGKITYDVTKEKQNQTNLCFYTAHFNFGHDVTLNHRLIFFEYQIFKSSEVKYFFKFLIKCHLFNLLLVV